MTSYKNLLAGVLILLFSNLLSGCNTTEPQQHYAANDKDGAPLEKIDVSKIPNAVPKVEPKSPWGNKPTYVAMGKKYHVLSSATGYNQRGMASWYGTKF